MCCAGPAAAQEVITVTGSRLSSTFAAPTPVTVIDATEIKQSGFVNIEDTLNDTPQFRGSQGDGKFNNGSPAGNASINLRGPRRPAQPGYWSMAGASPSRVPTRPPISTPFPPR